MYAELFDFKACVKKVKSCDSSIFTVSGAYHPERIDYFMQPSTRLQLSAALVLILYVTWLL